MSFGRVLLVNPPSGGEWRGIRPHIGLGYIAQALADAGVEHDVIDMNLGYKPRHLQSRIEAFRPDLVATTLLTLEYRKQYELLARMKEENPGVALVVGGPHVTIMRDRVLKECPAIDYGVVYEGEEAILQLSNGTRVEDIAGLLHRADGEIVYNGDRQLTKDLDRLSWPRYEKFELDRYIPEAEIYSSRGCPHLCIFCPNRIISPVFRARSPEHVLDEMEYWYGRGYRQFNFDDDNFNLIKDRVYAICDGIERRGLKDLFLRCSNGIRADRMDRDVLARMREVGFHYMAFGADAGNNRMLEIVKKGETIEQIEQAVKDATELGYETKLLYVVGTPQETWADVEDKVRLAERYPIQDVHFYNIIPYPGTELYDWIEENNLFLKPPEEYLNDVTCLENTPVFETPELPKEERLKLFAYLKEVQKRVHRRTVQRLLKGRGIVGSVAGRLIASEPVEKLFYQSTYVRKAVDRIRYRRAVKPSG
ncbi:MAG: radical SAM protein [Actinobacteria bacterium]|nr:MAG: radical SAM protein [Actinomycetota bacterium]